MPTVVQSRLLPCSLAPHVPRKKPRNITSRITFAQPNGSKVRVAMPKAEVKVLVVVTAIAIVVAIAKAVVKEKAKVKDTAVARAKDTAVTKVKEKAKVKAKVQATG